MNELRDIRRDFYFLAEEKISSINIVDRFLFAADHNVNALERLIIEFSKMWNWHESTKIKKVTLTYGHAGSRQDEQMWKNNAIALIMKLRKNEEFQDIHFTPVYRPHHEPRGDKHDRRIIINSKPETLQEAKPSRRKRSGKAGAMKAKSKIFTAELTGGVTYLMDQTTETTVMSWVK